MTEVSRPGRASLAGRLLGVYAVVFLGVIVGFSLLVTTTVRTSFERRVIEDLAATAQVAAVELSGDLLVASAAELAVAAEARLTVIGSDGVVLYDSVAEVGAMDNHAGRPEIVAALNGEVGTSVRVSATTSVETNYVAVPMDDGGVVRLALTAQSLDTSDVAASVLAVALVAGVAGVLLVWLVARRFARPIKELTDVADSVAAGELVSRPRRSSLSELDRLGMAIGRISTELGRRVVENEAERLTLESVLAALPQGVILADEDDAVLYANSAAMLLLGEIPPRLSSISTRGLHRCVSAARDTGFVQELELERGSPARILGVVATRLANEGRVLAVISDVTEYRRVEAMRRDFVADASHELKTPVAAVLASAEAMQLALSRDPERAIEFAERVEASAHSLSRIVADLLDLSRLDSSEQIFEPTNLDVVVEAELVSLGRKAELAGIELRVDLHPAQVMGSGSDLALAFRNLVDNALRHTERTGIVSVSLSESNDNATLSVADTGTGIPTRALGRVFERFYRVDEARSRAGGGTGLGLAIVRHVAERHGGKVSVTSQLGVGSTFVIELPSLRPKD